MTDEQINAAIAEACGWKLQCSPEHQKATEGWQFGHTFAINPSNEVVSRNSIPNYCTDLNAMHEAEEMLPDEIWLEYSDNIQPLRSVSAWVKSYLHLTARQRAEAFLRTLDKWEEAE